MAAAIELSAERRPSSAPIASASPASAWAGASASWPPATTPTIKAAAPFYGGGIGGLLDQAPTASPARCCSSSATRIRSSRTTRSTKIKRDAGRAEEDGRGRRLPRRAARLLLQRARLVSAPMPRRTPGRRLKTFSRQASRSPERIAADHAGAAAAAAAPARAHLRARVGRRSGRVRQPRPRARAVRATTSAGTSARRRSPRS